MYPRPLVPVPHDPTVDFRAFYPYTPNEVKHRKRTTSAQLKVLEGIFKNDTKPNASLRTELALQLDMTPRGVQVWFQNRRAKEKVKGGKATASKSVGAAGSSAPKEEEFAGALSLNGEADDEDEDAAATAAVQRDESEEVDAFSQSPTISQSPTSVITSPPQLHLITDATKFDWQDSPVDVPPDSATFPIRPPANPFMPSARGLGADPFHRRGSLPATAFPHPDSALDNSANDIFESLPRRSSVDTSLQRLASNPFASLARAKNSALYGPGVGVAMPGNGTAIRHHQLNRTPYGHSSNLRRNVSSTFASQPMSQHSNTRRLSMDSRASRFSTMPRMHHSPSPSPLTPYDAVIRASLPDHHLYAVSSRTVASPIPGPLPSPGFSFGAASTPSMASPSSGDSERNSPDSIRSFPFRSEEHDEDATSPGYDAYSRFGSLASIATSESSITSSYYAEIGGPVAEHNVERRDSCAPGFLGLLSELELTNQHDLHQSMALASYSPHEEYHFANAAKDLVVPADVGLQQQQLQHPQVQQPHTEGSYPSPTSTISPRDTQSPHAQDASASVGVPISTSSELAFALEGKPDQNVNRQEQYITYNNGSEHHQSVSEQDNTPFYTTQQQSQEAHVQQQQAQQQQESAYGSAVYTSINDTYDTHHHHHQQQQNHQQLDYLSVYTSNGAYADPLSASGAVMGMDNGMQSVDAFAYA
ncbi:hypothetical protein BDN70DRAFT_365134 [Pholiota conissans]|uniref:Homeobox domain-containing protein n=1 Tax=Pholiota conissans TaxID=109636 RepID=A0A9P5ZGE2_9AGAR|nr:hypothetical protein BDN70DRAFT_365134 [Pholiota conissans]